MVTKNPHGPARGQYRRKEKRVESGEVNDFQLGRNRGCEALRRVAAMVMNRFVLIAPEKSERGNGNHSDTSRRELRRGPAERAAIVGHMFEHIKKAEYVHAMRKRLGNSMVNRLKSIAVFAFQMIKRRGLHLRAENGSERFEHRQIAAAGAANLGDLQGVTARTETTNRRRDDFSPGTPPPVAVFNVGVNIVLSSVQLSSVQLIRLV